MYIKYVFLLFLCFYFGKSKSKVIVQCLNWKPKPNTHYQVTFLCLTVENLNTCPFLSSWGTYICKVSPGHKESTQPPFRESECTYLGVLSTSCMKTRSLGFNSFFLIPPPSCFAMCSKCILLVFFFLKSKLGHGAQDNQVEQEVSIFTSLCGTLKCKQ